MENLAFGDLNIQVIVAAPPERTIRLVWTGKSNDRTPGRVLDPFLNGVVEEAAEQGAGVEMRFERLDHFNSSTITSLIGLVQKAQRRSVRLLLSFDKTVKWQKLSFDALRVLAKGDGLLEIRSI
jgi:hypothetical protein